LNLQLARAIVRIATLLALLAVAVPVSALNMSGFRDAPMTRLTEEELKAFRAAVMKVLDETPDGTTVEWKAPKTQFVSKITPLKTYAGKFPCRDATIESDARDRHQRGLYTFCKARNNEWQFSSRPPAGSK
jgi:surface antigen